MKHGQFRNKKLFLKHRDALSNGFSDSLQVQPTFRFGGLSSSSVEPSLRNIRTSAGSNSISIIGVRVSIDDRANVLGERGPLLLFAARLRGMAQSGCSASFTMGQPISVRQALSSEVSGGPTR